MDKDRYAINGILYREIIPLSHYSTVSSSPCQVYPSEYAYRDDSVSRAESGSANCRMYPAGILQGGLHAEDYIHCDGTQLVLADSDLGREQNNIVDYYVWSTGSTEQLLFIFPTRASLTTITLHYYSDSARGLPRLRFYAVPDDFEVWDALTTSIPRVNIAAVAPDAGRRNVSINVNFNTKRVSMYNFSSTYSLAVSEVEFFKRKSLDIAVVLIGLQIKVMPMQVK